MQRCKTCKEENADELRICKYCGSTMRRDDAKKRLSSMRFQLGVLASHVTPFTPISELTSSPPAGKTPSGSLLIATTLILINILLAFIIQPRNVVTAETSPKLIVTNTTLDFITKVVGDQPTQTLNIMNGGGQLLKWQVDTGGANWITLTVVQGKLGYGDGQVVKVIINTDKLLPRDTPYTAILAFTSNGGKQVVKVIIKVAPPPQTALLCIDTPRLDFKITDIGPTYKDQLGIRNCGGQTLQWKASLASSSKIKLDTYEGTLDAKQSQQLLVSIDTSQIGANTSPYQETITFSSNTGQKSIPVRVTVTIQQTPAISPSPSLSPQQIPSPSPLVPTWLVNPSSLDPNNNTLCGPEVHTTFVLSWACTVTLSEDTSSQVSINWQATSNLASVKFAPLSQQLTPGAQQSIIISAIPCQNGTFTFSGSGGAPTLMVQWSCPVGTASLGACTYTAGSGWTCPLNLSADPNNLTNWSWTATVSEIANSTVTPSSDTLSPGHSEQATVTIPDTTCPNAATISVSGPTIHTPLPWSCNAPPLTVTPTAFNQLACNGNATAWVCPMVVTLSEPANAIGDLSWSISSQNGAAVTASPMTPLFPGQQIQVTLTIPSSDCNQAANISDTFNFSVIGSNASPSQVTWSCSAVP